MILPKTKKRRKKPNNKESKSEDNKDRISDLPDCVLLHILSFLNTKHAVQTCILSTRWSHLWKRLPTLTLSSKHFRTLKVFTKFVSGIFYLRDSSTALHDLDFHRKGFMEPHLFKRIVNYAASHDVQRLRISVTCDIERLPPCIFSCQTLTFLSLSVNPATCLRTPLFPNTLNLPALTTLYLLQFLAFRGGKDGRAEPFSACNRNSVSNLSSIKQVNIGADISWYKRAETPLVLLSWLMELSDIISLTVSSNALQVLSLVPDLLKVKLPSLCNLKSLNVIMKPLSYELRMILTRRNPNSLKEAAKRPYGIVDFLLQNSPLAKVYIIDWSRAQKESWEVWSHSIYS